MKEKEKKFKNVPKELLVNQIAHIKPRTIQHTVFVYQGIEDNKNLMAFIGKPLTLTMDGTFKIKKFALDPPCFVFRTISGNVYSVLPLNEVVGKYEIVKTDEFNDSYVCKEKKVITPEKNK